MDEISDFRLWMSLFSKWKVFDDPIFSPLDVFNLSSQSTEDILEPIEHAMQTIGTNRFSYNTDCASAWITHKTFFGCYTPSEGEQSDTDDNNNSFESSHPVTSFADHTPLRRLSASKLTRRNPFPGLYTSSESSDNDDDNSNDEEGLSKKEFSVSPNINHAPDISKDSTSEDSYLERYGPSPIYENYKNFELSSPFEQTSSDQISRNTLIDYSDLCTSYEERNWKEEEHDYNLAVSSANYRASVRNIEKEHTYYSWMMMFYDYECSSDNSLLTVICSPNSSFIDLDATREAPACPPVAKPRMPTGLCMAAKCYCYTDAHASHSSVPANAMHDFSSMMNITPAKEAENVEESTKEPKTARNKKTIAKSETNVFT